METNKVNMKQECEWLFDYFIKLPFGFSIIKLKSKYRILNYYRNWALRRKIKNKDGSFSETYWPKDLSK